MTEGLMLNEIVEMQLLQAGQVTDVAKSISDYGFMVVVCAVFIVLSMGLMVACFRWFKSIIEKIMGDYSMRLDKIHESYTQISEAIVDVAEALAPETQLRIKNISSAYFDLAELKVLQLIQRVRKENHIANRDATVAKIRRLLTNIYEDRCSKFDCFHYRGRKLSEYCNKKWTDWVQEVFVSEIYSESGANDERARTNVKAIYDNIKLDFYHRIEN